MTIFASASNGRFAQAHIMSSNGAEAVYSVAAPMNMLIRLATMSPLTLTDMTGHAISGHAFGPTLQTGGLSLQTINLLAKD
jgi:hypothetical protein